MARTTGYCAVAQRNHLHQTTGFEQARHEQEVRTCINQVSQFRVEPQLQVTVRIVVQLVPKLPELTIDGRFGAWSQQDKLSTMSQRVIYGVPKQVDALLRNQVARHKPRLA